MGASQLFLWIKNEVRRTLLLLKLECAFLEMQSITYLLAAWQGDWTSVTLLMSHHNLDTSLLVYSIPAPKAPLTFNLLP